MEQITCEFYDNQGGIGDRLYIFCGTQHPREEVAEALVRRQRTLNRDLSPEDALLSVEELRNGQIGIRTKSTRDDGIEAGESMRSTIEAFLLDIDARKHAADEGE